MRLSLSIRVPPAAITLLLSFFLGANASDAVAFWTRAGGFEGGYVEAITFDSSGRGFVSTWGDGIYRSTDGGAHWERAGSDFPAPYSTDVMVAPNGHVFASAWHWPTVHGIYRSIDGGDHWVSASVGLPTNMRITTLACNPSGVLFAGAEGGGIYRSLDDGQSWVQMANLGNNVVHRLVFDSLGRLYAASQAGLRRSSDLGVTWTIIQPSFYPNSDVTSIALIERLGLIVFGTEGDGTYRTYDDGVTQQKVHNRRGTMLVLPDETILMGTNWSSGTVYRSTDAGASWSLSNAGIAGEDVHDLARNPDGSIYAASGVRAIYRSVDGGNTWARSATGVQLLWAGALGAADSTLFGTGGDGAIYVSSDYGGTWSVRGPQCAPAAYVPIPGAVLAASTSCGILRSADDGATWPSSNTGLTNSSVSSILRLPSGRVLAGGRSSGSLPVLHLSDDGGQTWSPVTAGISNFSVLALLALQGDDVLASGYDAVSFAGRLMISHDRGATWSVHSTSGTVPRIQRFQFDSAGRLFALAFDGLYLSLDQGSTWTRIGTSIYAPTALVIDWFDRLYAGSSDNGVFLSEDHGLTWSALNTGLSDLRVNSLMLDDAGYLFAGTDTGPFFGTVSIPIGVGPASPRPLIGLEVLRVDSNPGRGEQRLWVAVDRPGTLRLRVHDVTGRCISRSESWIASAGTHARRAFTRTPAPGLYLIEIEHQGRRTSARTTVVR